MKILIACDSFKDALPSLEVCRSIEQGLKKASADVETIIFPLADGGEGTFDVLHYHVGLQREELVVNDPLFRPTKAYYGVSADNKTAFIEMAQAAGLQKLWPHERNPMITSTFGVGEMILHAITRDKIEKIILTLGSSSTNDAGIGMAAALGFSFTDINNQRLRPVGESLISVHKISVNDNSTFDIFFKKINQGVKVEVLCDVTNPLFGETGAAYTFAKQKGATDEMMRNLDEGLRNFAHVNQLRDVTHDFEGAGAAGGLGYGARIFLDAQLRHGADIIMSMTDFDAQLQDVDLIITGEGKLDSQTANGKLIECICKKANKKNIPVIALCGAVEASPALINKIGLLSAFSIQQEPTSLEQAIIQTKMNLERTAFNILRVWEHWLVAPELQLNWL